MSRLKRALPWLAAALFLFGALAWLNSDATTRGVAYPAYSSYNVSGAGTSLAIAYLQQNGKAAPLHGALDRSGLESNAVVFRVAPKFTPAGLTRSHGQQDEGAGLLSSDSDPLLTPGEERWVRGGGRLVLAINKEYGPLQVEASGSSAPVRKAFPLWPGVESLQITRPLNTLPLKHAVSILTRGESTVAARMQLDAGDVILLTGPEIFQNSHLHSADHLKLLVALAESGRPVYFDERLLGLRGEGGALEVLKHAGFMPFVLMALACGGLLFWRRAVRLGVAEDPHRETRNVTVDLVDSVAPLYDQALRRHQAIALYYRALVQAVSAQTGLRGEALARRIRELAPGLGAPPPVSAQHNDMPVPEFKAELAILNEAFRRLDHGRRG